MRFVAGLIAVCTAAQAAVLLAPSTTAAVGAAITLLVLATDVRLFIRFARSTGPARIAWLFAGSTAPRPPARAASSRTPWRDILARVRTVLILGGTGEARRLAAELAALPGCRVISSLAGRVSEPALPPGEVRIGGFGGPSGLAAYVREQAVDVVIDATHPFAAGISASAAAAGVPRLLVLRRPGWTAASGDVWHRVPSLDAAASFIAASPYERVFLTTGRQGLGAFAGLADRWFLVRSVEPVEPPHPPDMESMLDRGPYTVDRETVVLSSYTIQLLVTKDSGGSMTAAKLTAARLLGVPVLMVDRPPVTPGVPVVASVEEAVTFLRAHGVAGAGG